ncbi:3-hydroxyisobutyrate dehydrogenase [Azospirillum agricola]|uniref:3-hydroxyisobutyrate dehydrogenase n=1 Tax=Azospirillum agricola TaxID=1720247 RepID=UPI0037C0085F
MTAGQAATANNQKQHTEGEAHMAVIGFIGLGNMGGPMAANLVKAGHSVRGFDLVPAAIEAAREAGVAIGASPADVAREADIVITMLPSGKHVLGVYDGAEGIVAAARPGALLIDSSTIDVDSARKAHALAAAKGAASLDAPVSGGVGGAAAGTLTFMAGGEADAFERARPVLEAMGKKIVLCGGAGAGQAAKICNNMILGISMIGVCEAFVLAEKLGLSHQSLFDVASTASGQCWSLTSYCPVPGPVPASPANRDYQPGFAAALMLKDLKLAQEASQSAGAPTPLGAAATQLYAMMAAAGEGGADFSGIIRMLRGDNA